MKISRFANDPHGTPLHSNGIAGGVAPKPQPFSERQQLEKHRQIIQAYHQSMIGSQSVVRGRISSKKRVKSAKSSTVPSRQEFSAGEKSFREPRARGFNSYS